MCLNITDCLTELGYVPQRQKVQGYVLSFHNRQVNQTIAKIGVRGGKVSAPFFSIKFYACKSPPEKFLKAVQRAVSLSQGQYKCCGCNLCGAALEERGYLLTYPDGSDFVRCGAYAVEIPGLAPEDIGGFNSLLAEQHAYFQARHPSATAEGSK